MEQVLADTVLKEFKIRLGRIGLDPNVNSMEVEDLSEAMAASIAALQ